MVDLTTFQLLDSIFLNVREVPVLEFMVCDKSHFKWISFDRHVSHFNPELYGKGLALLPWPEGIASEEVIHGAAEIFTHTIGDIRKAFKFRCLVYYSNELKIKFVSLERDF